VGYLSYYEEAKYETTSLWDSDTVPNSLNSNMISVAIIEDIKEIRDSLQQYLSRQANFLCEYTAGSVEEFLAHVNPEMSTDIVLMDIGLPGISGISGIALVKGKLPDVDIIMFTIYDDHNKIFQALRAGAAGYLLKNTSLPKMKEALEELYSGGAPMSPQIARKVLNHFQPALVEKQKSILTEKEQAIVAGLVEGLSYKMIAANQTISIETVRHHIKNIYRKLHINSKAEAIHKSLKGEI
jgi:DNA-binding NarL/FixJ family response regulator